MSGDLLTEIRDVLQNIGIDIHTISSALMQVREFGEDLMSVERSDRDENDVFRIVKHFRDDGTLYRKSTLSGGTSPEYTSYVIEYYDATGLTVVQTRAYTMTYSNGEMVSRTYVPPQP